MTAHAIEGAFNYVQNMEYGTVGVKVTLELEELGVKNLNNTVHKGITGFIFIRKIIRNQKT